MGLKLQIMGVLNMCNHFGEILLDKSKTGRERPWKTHKTSGLLLSDSFRRLGKLSKADLVHNCGSMLKFNTCPHGHEKRLSWANFCRVRLCPMCAWRRSLLVAHQVKLVSHEAVQRQPLRWLFLTLTVRNCDSDQIQDVINYMMKSWTRFVQRKQFKNAVIGWFRAFEITRNMFDDTYHPHFHVLLAVPPSYFKKKELYLQTEDWEKLWKQSLKADYDPIVDVRVVKNKRNVEKETKILEEKGIEILPDGQLVEADLSGAAVAEISKYATKSSDYLVYKKYKQKQEKDKVVLVPVISSGIDEEKTDEVVSTLDSSLSRRRLLGYGGLLKEIWNELQLSGKVQDAEDDHADLVHVDDDSECQCSVCGSNMLEELYSWLPDVGNYIKSES